MLLALASTAHTARKLIFILASLSDYTGKCFWAIALNFEQLPFSSLCNKSVETDLLHFVDGTGSLLWSGLLLNWTPPFSQLRMLSFSSRHLKASSGMSCAVARMCTAISSVKLSVLKLILHAVPYMSTHLLMCLHRAWTLGFFPVVVAVVSCVCFNWVMRWYFVALIAIHPIKMWPQAEYRAHHVLDDKSG